MIIIDCLVCVFDSISLDISWYIAKLVAVRLYLGQYDTVCSSHFTSFTTVNSEIFVKILLSRIALKDIFAMLKICHWGKIYLHQ